MYVAVGDIVDVTFSVGNNGDVVVKWFYIEGYFKIGLIDWQAFSNTRTRELFMPEEPLPDEQWRVQVTEVVYSNPDDLGKGYARILPLERLGLTAEEKAERAQKTQLIEVQRLRVARLIEAEYSCCPFCQAALDGKHYCQALLKQVRLPGDGRLSLLHTLKLSRYGEREELAALMARCEFDERDRLCVVCIWVWQAKACADPLTEEVQTHRYWEEATEWIAIGKRENRQQRVEFGRRIIRLRPCFDHPGF